MRKLHTAILVCIGLHILFFGCSQGVNPNGDVTVDALPFSDTLRARVVPLDNTTDLLEPWGIVNVNDQYIIVSTNIEDEIFQVFNLPDLEFLYSWGQRGSGPDEFELLPIIHLNVKNDELIIYDIPSRYLRYYSVEDTAFVGTEQVPLSYEGQMEHINRPLRMNDSLYVVEYGTMREETDHEYIALKPGENEPLFTFSNYPESELTGTERDALYYKISVAKPDGSRFAAFYARHNLLKIFNPQEEIVKVQIMDPYLPDDEMNEGIFRYRGVSWATNNYIYTIGLNATRERLSEDLETHLNSLEIWNWEGEPVFRAMFDRPVHGFTVSEVNRKLYAYSALKTTELYEFDLPDIPYAVDVDVRNIGSTNN